MNKVFFNDTETTGLPEWKEPSGGENQPHIVQLAGILADKDTRKVIATMNLIVRPDGWEIPEEVTEIHGISTAHALEVGVPEKLAVEVMLALCHGAERVSHNKTFDQRIIRIALKRFFDDEAIATWATKDDYHCTMIMSKPILKLTPKTNWGYKNPNLEEAYYHFTGVKLEGAHSAMADTQACMAVYWGLLDGAMATTPDPKAA